MIYQSKKDWWLDAVMAIVVATEIFLFAFGIYNLERTWPHWILRQSFEDQ